MADEVRMRRSFLLLAALAAAAALTAGFAASAGAYGGGAGHDMWQAGVSFNCNSPTSEYCLDENGQPSLGGFWGWAEFDRYADGSITGDAEFAGCNHTTRGGGPGSAGAGHISIDITAAHIGPGGQDDPPEVDVFYVDHNVVTFTFGGQKGTMVDDPDFLGDSGIPAEAGHYPFHPAPGVAGEVQVAYRAAK
jgi:hypothetical protein